MAEINISNDTLPVYSHTAMMVRGFLSNRSSLAELELDHEISHFEQVWLDTSFANSLQWACHPNTTSMKRIRHVIKNILSRPYTSVSAEKVFSTASHQTGPSLLLWLSTTSKLEWL
jgi:hypothetical protein